MQAPERDGGDEHLGYPDKNISKRKHAFRKEKALILICVENESMQTQTPRTEGLDFSDVWKFDGFTPEAAGGAILIGLEAIST